MLKSKFEVEVDTDALKELIYEQFKDTEFETECPNCHRSITAHVGENVCQFCGHKFPFTIVAKV